MHILVTGGTGFTGSHCVLELLQSNHTVTVIGNLANSISDSKEQPICLKRIEEMTGKKINFKRVDLLNFFALEKIFTEETPFDAVMHFASLKGLSESCRDPLKFYYSNIVGSLNLLSLCKKYNVKNFIFSSSVVVYGTSMQNSAIKEEAADGIKITSPYGQSKFMIEQMLRDIAKSDPDWNIICLRYSCLIGAHPSGLIGEDSKGIPSNLMPYICQVVTGKRPFLTIFGDNFGTPDGTCVRDYIHVMDAARANLAALNRILKEKSIGFEVYNIGMGKGHSVLEMVKAMQNASGEKIPIKIMEQRPGDVASIFCDTTKAAKLLKWKAQFTIEEICRDVWNWHKKNPYGYTAENDNSLKHG